LPAFVKQDKESHNPKIEALIKKTDFYEKVRTEVWRH
jgi:hypothetical protein